MSEQSIWTELKSYGFNDYAVAGIMGNMETESGLESNRLEGDFNESRAASRLYTMNVDDGSTSAYSFSHDEKGYGLCQWTFPSRKQGLYELCQQYNVSIGDEEIQLQFLLRELKNEFNSVYNRLMSATSVQEASDAFLLDFEKPANAIGQKAFRAGLGQKYYDKYKGVGDGLYQPDEPTEAPTEEPAEVGPIHVVKYGDKTWYGNAVQSLLRAHGYEISVDKDVRDGTMTALKEFASKYGLDVEADFVQLVYVLFSE